jgi:hypothetical protein
MCQDGADLRADLAQLQISPRAVDAMVSVVSELSDHFEAARRYRFSAGRHLEEALVMTTNLFALAGAHVRRIAQLQAGADLSLVCSALAAAAEGVTPCDFLNSCAVAGPAPSPGRVKSPPRRSKGPRRASEPPVRPGTDGSFPGPHVRC